MRRSLSLLVLAFQSACAAPGGGPVEGGVSTGATASAGTTETGSLAPSVEAGSTGALWTESLDAALFEASEPPRRRVVVDRPAGTAAPGAGTAAPGAGTAAPGAGTAAPGAGTPAPGAGTAPGPSVDALVGAALERLTAGDLEGAAGDLEEAFGTASGPTRTLVGRALADAWLGLRRHREAAELYETLLRESVRLPGPDGVAFVRANLAVAYYRLGRDDDARHEIGQALKLRPEHADALKTLGLIEQRAGRHLDSAEWFERALRIDPELPEARLALAERAEAQGEAALALDHYECLLAAYAGEKNKDFHRRWRNLFQPAETTTEGELRGRIERLRAKLSE